MNFFFFQKWASVGQQDTFLAKTLPTKLSFRWAKTTNDKSQQKQQKSKLNFTSFFCNWLLQGQGHLCLVIAIWATVMLRLVEWKKNNELDSYWTTEEGLPCQQWFLDMGTEISLNLILPVKIPYPQACPLRPFGHKSNATGDVEVLNWLAHKDTVHFKKLLVIELQCNMYFSQASVLSSNIQ